MSEAFKLSRRQRELYKLLDCNGDVAIDLLYLAMRGQAAADPSYAQRWLGSYVSGLNRKLCGHGFRVAPGQLKRTYALVQT